MHPILKILLFIPAAVLPAALDSLLLASDARVVGLPQVVVHALLWTPAIIVFLGAVFAWRGVGLRWVLLSLSGLSLLFGVGIAIGSWPFLAEEPIALAWVAALLGAPVLAWLLPSRTSASAVPPEERS